MYGGQLNRSQGKEKQFVELVLEVLFIFKAEIYMYLFTINKKNKIIITK